jgi:hypothetical protein
MNVLAAQAVFVALFLKSRALEQAYILPAIG